MDDELVCLEKTWSEFEAEMLVSRLRAAGIPAMVRREPLSVIMGLTVDGLGEHDVMVRSEDIEAARELLRDLGRN